MFNYIFAVGIILFSLNSLGQKKPLVLKEPCTFVDSTDFKGRKTFDFTITAKYFAIGRDGTGYDDLKKLKREHGIKRFPYAISFQPIGCEDDLYIPSLDKNFGKNFPDIQENTPIKLHCTAFNFYDQGGQIFFYIRKVEAVE